MGAHVTCCVLIETVEAIENIDAVLEVPGLDFVVVAPFDHSSSLGVEGQFDSPVLVKAVATVERAARGKVPLCGVTREQSTALAAKGYRVLLNGFDVLMLKECTAAFKNWRWPVTGPYGPATGAQSRCAAVGSVPVACCAALRSIAVPAIRAQACGGPGHLAHARGRTGRPGELLACRQA